MAQKKFAEAFGSIRKALRCFVKTQVNSKGLNMRISNLRGNKGKINFDKIDAVAYHKYYPV